MSFLIVQSCKGFPPQRLAMQFPTRANAWAMADKLLEPILRFSGPKTTFEIVEVPDAPPPNPWGRIAP